MTELERKTYKKVWYESHKESEKANRKIRHSQKKELENKQGREWYQANKEKRDKQIKEYQIENSDKRKQTQKESYQKHRSKRVMQRKLRRQSDSFVMLKHNIRSMVTNAFYKKGFIKNSKTEIIIGCTFEEFKTHIENKFENWMNWENRGLWNGELNYGWDLDHIIPLCTAKTEEEVLKLNHYTNFQPLCSKVNRHIKAGNI